MKGVRESENLLRTWHIELHPTVLLQGAFAGTSRFQCEYGEYGAGGEKGIVSCIEMHVVTPTC